MSTAPDVLERFGAAYLRLQLLLDGAAEAQWKPGSTIRPREDAGVRGKGGHSDPTFTAATDERRLRLRDAVREAERARANADRALAKAERLLRDALVSSGSAKA